MDKCDDENLRLDKWLWAARFFKTRSLAAEAVSGGIKGLAATVRRQHAQPRQEERDVWREMQVHARH